MTRPKTKILRVRVSENMYNFLQRFSKENKINNISELIRAILEYFYIGTAMGELKKFPKKKK